MRLLAAVAFLATYAAGQQGDTIRAIRLKLSAGDLPSAESVLEVHRAAKGEDPEYLMGLAWLARGGVLTGDLKAASRYAAQAAAIAQRSLTTPAGFEKAPEATYALGAAIEVAAQCRLASSGREEALRYLEQQAKLYAEAPVAFRSRLARCSNLIGLEGTPAPGIGAGEGAGEPRLSGELLGKPVVLFCWAEWCGDCKAQSAALRAVVDRYGPLGVQFLALTRFYSPDHDAERNKVEQVWRDAYPGLEAVPIVFNEAAMLRYGVSSTPTFVLVDRKGIVRLYSPTRMTVDRLSAAIDTLLR